MGLLTSKPDFAQSIHRHQPGPTSARQKRNRRSTHQCSLCSRWLQRSAQVPWRHFDDVHLHRDSFQETCSIESRYRRRWVRLWPDAWRFQSRTAWGFQTRDQAEDSGWNDWKLWMQRPRITWGLMSLWQMPFEWMYARDLEVKHCVTLVQCPFYQW